MFVQKKSICELEKCYSIAPFHQHGEPCFLVAAEKHAPCYLFDSLGNRLETVWTEPGGVMTMQQLPGHENQFLATHRFYSPNDSKQAKIVLATRRAENDWQIRTLIEAPFVHRFGILQRAGRTYLLVCCLKSGHDYKDDWTKPGKTFATLLPDAFDSFDAEHPLPLALLKENMGHNHGYSMYVEHGVQTGIVACDAGVFQFIPPENGCGDWEIRTLYDQPVSDAVLCDFDGDGEPELGCISPFHGDTLYICRKNSAGKYELVWQYPEKLEMLHASWVCALCGKPAWIVGHRKGARDLMVISYAAGQYQAQIIDHDCGCANAFHFIDLEGQDVIVGANRETNEIALYYVTRTEEKNNEQTI